MAMTSMAHLVSGRRLSTLSWQPFSLRSLCSSLMITSTGGQEAQFYRAVSSVEEVVVGAVRVLLALKTTMSVDRRRG